MSNENYKPKIGEWCKSGSGAILFYVGQSSDMYHVFELSNGGLTKLPGLGGFSPITQDLEKVSAIGHIDDGIAVFVWPEDNSSGMTTGKVTSGVMAKHIATGIKVVCDEHRSQHRNKEQAVRELKSLFGITDDN